MISRIVSIIVLLSLVVVFGVAFYEVMVDFLIPLFLAVLTAVLFQPVYRWLLPRLRNSRQLTAVVTLLIVLAAIFIPTTLLGFRAVSEANGLLKDSRKISKKDASPKPTTTPSVANVDENTSDPPRDTSRFGINHESLDRAVVWFNEKTGLDIKTDETQKIIVDNTQDWLGKIALQTPGKILSLVVGLGIMLVALYYFLQDGDDMIAGVGGLLPLDAQHQRRLMTEFADVSRAVASATLVSALAQGMLAGIGFYFAGLPSIALLMMLTMLASLIPFLGAAMVWVPCCLWLAFGRDDGMLAAVLLAAYCIGVVSMVDNLVKPMILKGRTNLHPLLALLSVLGGVQAVGAIGIFVGPMAVVFLQTALTMLKVELARTDVPPTTFVIPPKA
ncbi:MAG: AI-2E family transporter [Pirellulales bacterium]